MSNYLVDSRYSSPMTIIIERTAGNRLTFREVTSYRRGQGFFSLAMTGDRAFSIQEGLVAAVWVV